MDTKKCCFAGHSKISDESVREIIIDLIEKENVKTLEYARRKKHIKVININCEHTKEEAQ